MNNTIQQRVGARIRAARVQRGITGREVAWAIGVSYQQIWKYELGKSMISVGTIASIAQFLRMPISFFIEDAALPFDMLTSSSKRIALLDAYNKLDAPSRDLLISIAKSLGEARDAHRLAAE